MFAYSSHKRLRYPSPKSPSPGRGLTGTANVLRWTLLLIMATGCTRFLTVQPQGEVLPRTDEEFASIMHNRIKDIEGGGDPYVLGNMETVALFEGCADDLDANIRVGDGLVSYAGETINTRMSDYRSCFEIIRDCNIVIGNLEGRSTPTARGALGAAYAMKGILYYNLLREFAGPYNPEDASSTPGIPIVEQFDIDDMPVRASLKETAEYSRDLLGKAIPLTSGDRLWFFTTTLVKAYQARLAFWCEDWDTAAAIAEDIIDHSGLVLTPSDGYKAMLDAAAPTGEVIAKTHINNSSELDWYFSYMKGYIASRPVCAALARLYGPGDIRLATSFNAKRLNIKAPERRVRLSEMYLIAAESEYHRGHPDIALGYLNDLRSARIEGVVSLTETTLPPVRDGERITEDAAGKAVTPLLQAIFDERRKELYMEGDRFFELKRNGRPEWWVISNGLKYTTKKYLYTAPIYKQDCELNPDLQQNPGYED